MPSPEAAAPEQPAPPEPAAPEPAEPEQPAPPAPRLALAPVEVRSRRYDFPSPVHVRIEGAHFHLGSPASSEGGLLDRTRIYLADPVPLQIELRLSSGADTFVLALDVPAGAAPGDAVEIALAVDLETQVPSIEAVFPRAGSVSSNAWSLWTPPPPPPPEPEPAPEPEPVAEPLPAPVPEPAAAAPQPNWYGAYEALEPIESGPHANRFRARSRETGDPALLTLYPAADDRSRAAFFGSLLPLHVNHPNVVRVLDFGSSPAGWFVVAEAPSGETLRHLMGGGRERQPVDPDVVVPLALQFLSGLQALHQRHIFHRNLKPANLWLSADRASVRIAEFQIAVALRPGDHVGNVSGTLPYMAREVLDGRADHRADLYAAGVILFELTTGRLPFWAESQRQLAEHIASQQPPDPRSLNPRISTALGDAILRALAKDPARRFQTAEEFARALSSREEPSGNLLDTIVSQPPARGAAT